MRAAELVARSPVPSVGTVHRPEAGAGDGEQLSPNTTRDDLIDPAPYDGKQVYRNTKQVDLLVAQVRKGGPLDRKEPLMSTFFQRERLTPSLAQGAGLVLRVGIGVAAAGVLGAGAFVALFVGTVTITGCFISCGDQNWPVGLAGMTVAALLGGCALAAGWWAVADRGWRLAWRIITALVVLAAVGLPIVALTT